MYTWQGRVEMTVHNDVLLHSLYVHCIHVHALCTACACLHIHKMEYIHLTSYVLYKSIKITHGPEKWYLVKKSDPPAPHNRWQRILDILGCPAQASHHSHGLHQIAACPRCCWAAHLYQWTLWYDTPHNGPCRIQRATRRAASYPRFRLDLGVGTYTLRP